MAIIELEISVRAKYSSAAKMVAEGTRAFRCTVPKYAMSVGGKVALGYSDVEELSFKRPWSVGSASKPKPKYVRGVRHIEY